MKTTKELEELINAEGWEVTSVTDEQIIWSYKTVFCETGWENNIIELNKIGFDNLTKIYPNIIKRSDWIVSNQFIFSRELEEDGRAMHFDTHPGVGDNTHMQYAIRKQMELINEEFINKNLL